MDREELFKLIPNARSFFTIGDLPGVIMKDNQAWLFEDTDMPHPITRSEILARGGVEDTVDEVAELIGLQPNTVSFLGSLKKKASTNSTGKIRPGMTTDSLQTKAGIKLLPAASNPDLLIPT